MTFFLAFLFAFTQLEELKQEEASQIALLEQLSPSLVAIYPADGSSCGSGVLISPDGFALTNFHVVQPCGTWMKVGMADGKVRHAVTVGVDPVGDVALIKILPADSDETPHEFVPAIWGDSDQVQPGDPVWVLGNPFGFEEDFTPSVSHGIVSGTHRYQFPAGTFLEYTDCLQVDAPINPGNSGGPLFNATGELIGINGRCSFEKRGRINVGVGYAISINQIKWFLSHLKAGRVLDHATLGATVNSDSLDHPIVNAILDDSEAALRGLDLGDRITSFANRPVQTANEFKNILGIYPKGWIVPVEFTRKVGKKRESHRITVRLAGVHSTAELKKFLETSFASDEQPDEQPVPPHNQPELPEQTPKIPEELRHQMEVQAKLFAKLKEMPDDVKPFYEAREGFMNFYFNRQETRRVWNAFSQAKKQTGAEFPQKLSGKTSVGVDFELEFSDEKTILKQPTGDVLWENAGDFTRPSLPPESRLLLPGLTLWREFCRKGPESLELTYFGESPLPWTDDSTPEGLFDVLEGMVGGVQTRFYFAKESGILTQMELLLSDDSLPWEFIFEDGIIRIFAEGKIFEILEKH